MQRTDGSTTGHGQRAAVGGLLAVILALNLTASICFKEGGTNPALRWLFFVVGNALGITNTWLFMRLCQWQNANVAMALTSSLGFISVQLLYWRLYHSPLDWLQWGGIGMVLVGTLLTAWNPGPGSATQTFAAAAEGQA